MQVGIRIIQIHENCHWSYCLLTQEYHSTAWFKNWQRQLALLNTMSKINLVALNFFSHPQPYCIWNVLHYLYTCKSTSVALGYYAWSTCAAVWKYPATLCSHRQLMLCAVCMRSVRETTQWKIFLCYRRECAALLKHCRRGIRISSVQPTVTLLCFFLW